MYADSPEIQDDFKRCYTDRSIIKKTMSYHLSGINEIKELNVCYVFVPPNLILVHTEDVTQRKQAENELKKLSNAVEKTADSVVITNKQGVIEYVNPAFTETTGYTYEEIVGQKPHLLKSGMHDKVFYKKLWGTVLKGQTFRGTIVNKKKEWRNILVSTDHHSHD